MCAPLPSSVESPGSRLRNSLRRAVDALGDRVAADYLTHALICFVRGKDEPGEAWLRLTLDLLR